MKIRIFLLAILTTVVTTCFNGQVKTLFTGDMVAAAKAVIGRPATPVSYAGVAL